MKSDTLQAIEKQLSLLTADEQLCLIEQLAQKLRKPRNSKVVEAALAAMANDPQIQAELRQIESEFSVAESDGLEGL